MKTLKIIVLSVVVLAALQLYGRVERYNGCVLGQDKSQELGGPEDNPFYNKKPYNVCSFLKPINPKEITPTCGICSK